MDELRPAARSTGSSAAGRSTTSSRCRAACHSRRHANQHAEHGHRFAVSRIGSLRANCRRVSARSIAGSTFPRSPLRLSSLSATPVATSFAARAQSNSMYRSSRAFRLLETAARRVSRRGVQRPEHAAVQQSEREHRIQRRRPDHQRRKPDGVSAHVAANSAGPEGVFLANAVVTPPPPEPVSFSRDIAPIMAMHCNTCHGESGGISTRSYRESCSEETSAR